MPRRAFTLLEILIVIGIIGLLIGILLPTLEVVRHKSYITVCGSNLRSLGQGLTIYANENKGAYPRTVANVALPPVAGTGAAAGDPFGPGGPAANDVTSPVWLLLRVQKLPTKFAICPYNDVNEFEADRALPGEASNFTDYRKNLGYSYACPYWSTAFTMGITYSLSTRVGGSFPLMADLNPGVNAARKADVFAAVAGAPSSVMRHGNSDNHEREGQNVLFADGHVSYEITPLCGVNGDNIYTSRDAAPPAVMTMPGRRDDAVLLPAD